MLSLAIIVVIAVLGLLVLAFASYYAYNHYKAKWNVKTQQQWRNEWRLSHSNSMRGNLVKTLVEDVENNYYVDVERHLGKGGCGVVVTGTHKETQILP